MLTVLSITGSTLVFSRLGGHESDHMGSSIVFLARCLCQLDHVDTLAALDQGPFPSHTMRQPGLSQDPSQGKGLSTPDLQCSARLNFISADFCSNGICGGNRGMVSTSIQKKRRRPVETMANQYCVKPLTQSCRLLATVRQHGRPATCVSSVVSIQVCNLGM